MDLLSEEDLQEVERLAAERFPQKDLLLQNSLRSRWWTGLAELVEQHDWRSPELPETEIDYDRYDAGGRQLAWLDEQITHMGE